MIIYKAVKPPLGLNPRYVHDFCRLQEIGDAVIRYIEHAKLGNLIKINPEWIQEFNEIVERWK